VHGLRKGDVLLLVDGHPAKDHVFVSSLFDQLAPGEKLVMQVLLCPEEILLSGQGRAGMTLTNSKERPAAAIFVEFCEPGGLAARSGFLDGDLILAVNGQVATDTSVSANHFAELARGGVISILLRRPRPGDGRHSKGVASEVRNVALGEASPEVGIAQKSTLEVLAAAMVSSAIQKAMQEEPAARQTMEEAMARSGEVEWSRHDRQHADGLPPGACAECSTVVRDLLSICGLTIRTVRTSVRQ
jgi:hypothetical protein